MFGKKKALKKKIALLEAQQVQHLGATQDPEITKLACLPPGQEVEIRVRNLRKYYQMGRTRVKALDGVSFDVAKGEFCAVVGASGSGKSTLLNMLAGLEKPTMGLVELAGSDITKMNEKKIVRFRRDKIGFIFQSFNLISSLTALENVILPLIFKGQGGKVRRAKAESMIRLVGLEKYQKHRPSEMSGGQQQRVGIARALVVAPEIVFADEPTGNLDSKTSREIMQLLQEISKKNKQTMVMVTHDDYLAQFADRIFRILDGHLVSVTRGTEGYHAQPQIIPPPTIEPILSPAAASGPVVDSGPVLAPGPAVAPSPTHPQGPVLAPEPVIDSGPILAPEPVINPSPVAGPWPSINKDPVLGQPVEETEETPESAGFSGPSSPQESYFRKKG